MRHTKECSSEFVDVLREVATNKSWWDTVDGIAPCVGELVRQDPSLAATMDLWIGDQDMWLRRIAILYQLRYKAATDADRLFSYCELRGHETEFFIRKAIGWALREYAKTDPAAVRGFVACNETILSGLSKREALKNLDG